jgi:hypothetical protein
MALPDPLALFWSDQPPLNSGSRKELGIAEGFCPTLTEELLGPRFT